MEKKENVIRLIESLQEDDEHVRVQVIELLEEIGNPAVDPLIDVLDSPNKYVRMGAAKALGVIGDSKAIEPLIKTLKDDNKWVRRDASGALAQMGTDAVEPLINILSDDDWKVRGAATWALGNIKDPRAVEHLIGALNDESGFVRGGATWALGNIGGEKAESALKEVAKGEGTYTKKVASNYLNKDDN
ncbi:MAG: HEAT repeat domain-containing protein [Methanobacteriaceae archaeon]|nr:HEAT repeat domain-containing protein [Methanobacteriaceae archaeon]MDP2837427.1 HEAT repeat domain-containing protein [Methanobacteriaceae archaeon]MDP3033848.1 HEAT repeat domain-containing protein [Methanobacteriaceae archaeon]MDP3484984.1 HEAT repeat domain-containing protein [Methanobacteriaceae archaeon]MDP3624154.1 HEAT repeat domain-containing protein [Methanobacteriaceae archaeon]